MRKLSEAKIGDIVRLYSDGGVYANYSSFFKLNNLTEYLYLFNNGKKIDINILYKIVNIGYHKHGYRMLVLQPNNNFDKTVFLYGGSEFYNDCGEVVANSKRIKL